MDGGGTRNNPIPLRRMKNETGAGVGWENPILVRILMAENMGAVFLTLSAAYPLRMLLLGLDNDCCCAAITPVSSE